MSWLRLWIIGPVKPVGQLYGSPTALTSQLLARDRYCKYVSQTPRVERRICLEQIRPTVTPQPREGDQSPTRSLLLNSHFAVCSHFDRGRISSVGRALDCRAGGRGFDSRGRTNTQGLKITEK